MSNECNTEHIIKQRKTAKVLADAPWEASLNPKEQEDLIKDLLDLAACAPYHYKCAAKYQTYGLESSLPFRAYTLNSGTCRTLAKQLQFMDMPPGKIVNMLWAAEALIIMTWLPDVFGEQPQERDIEPLPFTGNLRNMEHIAASSAAIQNILLGATHKGFPNYWSSGGVLRQKPAREFLEISLDEMLLGCLFIFPQNAHQREVEIKEGKLHNEGKNNSTWSKSITLGK
ncbi:hypothetical protein OAQ85_01170 [Schleiferiaceae bacterium]|nr:hypothetical protein [Flavobacteriales bacterium]MDC1022025.1 hypothetical protein [Schleiferiaceae bacterium]|tara:strand:- start:88 stop:771 length:684 start_codon:yes stop_codon:yes gene_type:complete